ADPTARFAAIGLGAISCLAPKFQKPSLPQYASSTLLAARQSELNTAQQANNFDYGKLDGGVVHDNMKSKDVRNNTNWMIKGTEEERRLYAHEDDFGVDDTDPGDDGIDIFEAVPEYALKNWSRFLFNLNFIANLVEGFNIIYKNLTDNDPDQFKLEIIDPILTIFPVVKATGIEQLNFFPDNETRYPKPDYADDFRNDDVMGWLQVATISPVHKHFTPYTEHLDNFPVTNQMFRGVDGFSDDDLNTAMAEKRVFIANYKDFHQETVATLPTEAFGARLHAAIALFAIAKGGSTLKIIAIQPTQTPPKSESDWWFWQNLGWGGHEQNPLSKILTPADDYWSWQMAKNTLTTMQSMSAVVDHLSTHVYLGPIPVAFYRNIPKVHPLYPLLETHFMSLVSNNFIGIFSEVGIPTNGEFGNPKNGLLTGAIERLSGFSSTTFLNSTLRRAGEYHFVRDSTPVDRSPDDNLAAIGDYPQHDDNRILPIIRTWVSDYLSLYYSDDTDVVNDNELQSFLYQTSIDGQVNGFPASASTMDQLVDTITRIIYWMSANHALDRFPSFLKLGSLGYYNSKVPAPGEGRKSQQDWFNCCPPLNAGMGLFVFSRIFVDLPRDWHRSLGKYPQGQFMQDQRIYQHLTKFQTSIKQLDADIRVTNSNRTWSCELRMPSTITVSPWN
ncbi:MAG: lipoxygenase, partial [Psychrobium sp.]|nr:lipoxygenase [Psychrobium sp.]